MLVLPVAAASCGGGTVTPNGGGTSPSVAAAAHENPAEVKPGQLDSYYGFWSGGQSGEVRIMGVPSMRELRRIPVFNKESAYGWGTTNFSKSLLNGKTTGDTHHVHLSYTDGWYNGKYAFVNDKAQARLARIRLDYFEVDKITDIPNSQGTHGIFPSRNKIDAVYCNSEFRTPLDGNPATAPADYAALHTCIDQETMQVRWQVIVDGNLDLCATDYQGRYSMACCYNSEGAVELAGMMRNDQDWLSVFDLALIEADVKAGKGTALPGSAVPVLDGRRSKNPDQKYVLYIPIPKSPHGVNVDPTGTYAICAGKLSPTASVVAIDKFRDAFDGKIKPHDCVLAEPEIGQGPLHTAFDGRGNAYTSVFLDSTVVQWNIAKAIAGENPVIDRLDVTYQIGHINGSNSETKRADGKWIIALNKFSKDRFLPVGPWHAECEQLIDISTGKMNLVHDHAAHSEPHDAIIASLDPFKPKKVWSIDDRKFDWERSLAAKYGAKLGETNKIYTDGNEVVVFMTSRAPAFGLSEIRVPVGAKVTIVITNMDGVEDLGHGFCLTHHDINFGVSPGETVSVTFEASKRGVFWYYCPWFCHALHLEMRGRLIVE